MVDTASLQIRVTSGGIESADRRLSRLEQQGGRTERATDGLGRAFTRLAAPIALATTAAVSMVRYSASQAREMANLARIANTGFEAFQGYAYATEQVGVSAEKLADISKDVQDKLGDFVATGGGEFKDFFENIAPKVGLTAQALQGLSGPDVLIAVKKAMDDTNVSAEEQVFYLESLANDATLLTPLLKDNGAAMRQQAQEASKLGNVLSEINAQKLLDASEASRKFDTALKGLTKQASAYFAPEVSNATDKVTNAIVRMSEAFASGEFGAYLDAIAGKFDYWGEDVTATLNIVDKLLTDSFGDWGGKAESAVDFIIDAFVNLPENVRAVVQLMAVEFASLVDYGKAYGKAFGQSVLAEFDLLVDKAAIYSQELGDLANPFDGDTFDYEAELNRVKAATESLTKKYYEEANRQASITRKARISSIESILQERDSAVDSFENQVRGAKDLRAEYERLQEERRKNNEDKNHKTKPKDDISTNGVSDDQNREFDSLVASLRTEEEAIQASYDRRLAIILQNTEEGSLQQRDLLTRLTSQTDEQLLEINGGFWERYLAAAEDNLTNLDDLATSTIETFSSGVGQAFENMIFDAESLGDAVQGVAEGMARSMVNALGKMAAEWLAYQAVQLLVGSTTSTASAVAMTAQAEAASLMAGINAFSSTAAIPIVGPPAAPAAMSAALAVTTPMAASVAALSTAGIAGAFDHGGMIPAGKVGIVGEIGPEMIAGPATVTSRRTTADGGNSSSNQKPVTVIINNNHSEAATTTQEYDSSSGRVVEVIIQKTKQSIAQEFREGGGVVSRAAEGAYGLRRGVV